MYDQVSALKAEIVKADRLLNAADTLTDQFVEHLARSLIKSGLIKEGRLKDLMFYDAGLI